MAPAFLQRFTGGNQTPLQADLKRATESNVIEVPKDVLALVVEATRLGEEERREIMMHLRECLAEPQGRRWRRIYAALVLMEELLKDGAPELVVETAEGRYFDLVQRLSLLEKFECTNDLRVQNMVRTKATGLRSEVVPRLETAGDAHASHASHKPATSSHVEAGSTGGSGGSTGGSTASGGSSAGYTGGQLYNMAKPESQLILNGVVAVGHNDDTDSDSDGRDGPKRAVAYRKAQSPTIPSSANKTPSSSKPNESGNSNVDLLDL
ncbi:Epsin-3 [Durusdinium trenchii]